MSSTAKDQTAAPQTTDPIEARRVKLEKARAAGIETFAYNFDRKHLADDLQAEYESLENGAETEDSVTVAGRITAMRNSGMFIDLTDSSGKIQIFSHKDSTPAEELDKLQYFDLGDVIGVTGVIRRTPRGELSIRAKEITLLTKALHPLPEKYHGLQDIEQRYRQRYLDLIANDEAKKVLRQRSIIINELRQFLTEKWDGIEVETPILQPIMGGASAKPFITHHNALDSQFYLRVATELYLKRLIVGGYSDCVFEIGKNFRNEGVSTRHNPEFTAVELYKTYTDYTDMMRLTEELVEHLALKLHGTTVLKFGEKEIDVKAPWRRATMCELVKEATGIDFLEITDRDKAAAEAKALGIHIEERYKWGEIVLEVFEEKVEPNLIQPIHVTDHPLDVSPLAKKHRDNPILTERFESFINTWEIANAFTELNDPIDQRSRFESQVEAREAGDEEAQMLDEDFVTALEVGMPPTGGWGMGVDRLVMILTNSHNIRDVINFPTLKPLKTKE